MKNRFAFLAALGILAVTPGFAMELSPCKEQGMPPEARCGTYEVFENRAARTGRKIPLKIVVIPATGPGRLPDPITFFAGRPGGGSIPFGLSKANSSLVGREAATSAGGPAGNRHVRRALLHGARRGASGQGFLDHFCHRQDPRLPGPLEEGVDLSW